MTIKVTLDDAQGFKFEPYPIYGVQTNALDFVKEVIKSGAAHYKDGEITIYPPSRIFSVVVKL